MIVKKKISISIVFLSMFRIPVVFLFQSFNRFFCRLHMYLPANEFQLVDRVYYNVSNVRKTCNYYIAPSVFAWNIIRRSTDTIPMNLT